MPLDLSPNLDDPDGFYESLLAAHQDLDKEESDALNARLILILANHIGDLGVLREALDIAARGRNQSAIPAKPERPDSEEPSMKGPLARQSKGS